MCEPALFDILLKESKGGECEHSMTVEMVLEKVKELCVKYQAEDIILFGSRAKGTALMN